MKQFSLLAIIAIVFSLASCGEQKQQTSDSGVMKASVQVQTDVDGHTIEQKNIIERLKRDNDVGAIKHLYVISSFTGDVMEYSTVVGKVTSGSKRLSPKTVDSGANLSSANIVIIGNERYFTQEVLDDGGSYGDSGAYLFWFDAQGNYHQYYPSGGTYLHISEKPLRIRKSSLTFDSDVK